MLNKVDHLAQVLGIYSLNLLVSARSKTVRPVVDDALLSKVTGELERLSKNGLCSVRFAAHGSVNMKRKRCVLFTMLDCGRQQIDVSLRGLRY